MTKQMENLTLPTLHLNRIKWIYWWD